MPKKKQTLKYFFSVEGQTEQWYLQWLAAQINAQDQITRTVQFKVKVEKNPISFVKRSTVFGGETFIHVFDVEGQEQRYLSQFENTLSRLKKAETYKKITYKAAYSNLSFELWLILHKKDFRCSLCHCHQYLDCMNSVFNQNFASLKEFKEEKNFKQTVLSKLNFEDVLAAIARAESIEKENRKNAQSQRLYKYDYFKDNPSLSIHSVIRNILKDCGLV